MVAKNLKRTVSMFAAGMAFLFWPLALAVAGTGESIDKKVEDALLQENWEEVAKLLDEVSVDHPFPVLRMIKGHACLALNRNNESLCLFLSAFANDLREWERWSIAFAERNTLSTVAGYLNGDGMARLRKLDEAVSTLNRALAMTPQHILCLNARAVVHAAKGDVGQAAVDFDEALSSMKRQKRRLADVLANIGALKIQKRDGAKSAFRAFSEAEKTSPGFAFALHGRGCVQLVLNEIKKAEEDFKAAEANAPCAGRLFSENMLNIAAYLGGKTKDELYAMLTNPGTTFDASFSQVNKVWENYKQNPNQWNYNRFAEQFGSMGTKKQRDFFNSTMKSDMAGSGSLRSAYETNLNAYYAWNVRGHADYWTNTTQRSLATIAALSPEPLVKTGAVTGALALERPKQWTTHNADSAKTQASLYQDSFSKPVGGVDSRIRFDDGKWPFDPYYGLSYHRYQ